MGCEILSEKVVKIKKPHICFACGRTFPVGTMMTYQVNVFDGDFCSIYTCNTCSQLFIKKQHELWDDLDSVFPEFCVDYALQQNGYETPEQWLESANKEV